MAERLTLLSMPFSGNSCKFRLLLALLGRDCALVPPEYGTPELAEAESRGDYDLSGLPAIRDWLARIAALPDHVPLEHLPA